MSRTMQPWMVWLLLIPIVNLILHFFVVRAESQSLANEFRARGIPSAEPEPGKTLGMVMCDSAVLSIIPFLGIVFVLAAFVLWIMYWFKIAGFSRLLDWRPATVVPGPVTGAGDWPQA